MALGTNQQTITTGANFIPELWINEVRAFLRASLVLADKVKMIQFAGRAGDTLHIPDVTELVTSAKAANTQVTLQSPTEGVFNLSINFHQESSYLIEDILNIQSAYDLRSEYTKASGYAIAKKIDQGLGNLAQSLTTRVIGADGVTAFNNGITNQSDLAEAGIRRVLETLDTANVPLEDRCLWIHPAQKNVLLGIARFTEFQMIGTGGMPIRTGQFGEIFGVPVYVSTQPTASGTAHGNLLFQRNAFTCAIQSAPRVQAAYILEHLGWLVVVDVIYGYAVFRDNHANAIYTPV